MPEYLAPGVFVEEVSFRSKSIEGVSTSTAGFVGPTRFGPISGEPELLTSFADFERIYGGLEPLRFGTGNPTTNFLAHAVRGFFDEGGRRLYIARAYDSGYVPVPGTDAPPEAPEDGRAVWQPDPSPPVTDIDITARHPGTGGNRRLIFEFELGQNALIQSDGTSRLVGLRRLDVVLVQGGAAAPTPSLYWVDRTDDGQTLLRNDNPLDEGSAGGLILEPSEWATLTSVRRLTVNVTLVPRGRFESMQEWNDLGFHNEEPGAGVIPSLSTTFAPRTPEPRRRTTLYVPVVFDTALRNPAEIARELIALPPIDRTLPAIDGSPPVPEVSFGSVLDALAPATGMDDTQRGRITPEHYSLQIVLEGGHDGERPEAGDFGSAILAFEELENISIIAAPGSTHAHTDPVETAAIFSLLITHCEKMRYRVAVLDTPDGMEPSDALNLRSRFDSTRAALYYPWIWNYDPIAEREFLAPPSGAVAGIYARTDIERGVHKSPANEVVRQALGFESLINKAQQETLNPKGVNCLRFFEGRGFRVWGARTMSSDPEWKYLNVRRYFLWLERSIELGTQWAVFENNGPVLWKNIRITIEDFLFNEWKSNHLLGDKPEEAFFVRCDRTTMSQNDLDNGRLICLIGVSPLRPAEFVVFRIGQKTADARR